MLASTPAPPHVGIFDSGVGGFSVLRTLHATMPGCRLTYVADNKFLPYGDKSPAWLQARSAELTQYLLDAGAQLILVACNTATTHTIASLRERWPAIPFVGIEPGIKPAVKLSRNHRVGVMATPATLASARLQDLVSQHAGDTHVLLLPCPGLAAAIEAADDDELARQVAGACATLRAHDVDTVVLGCTHYPLIADRLAEGLGPGILLVDTAEAVARRVRALLPAPTEATPAPIDIACTGALSPIAQALRRWIRSPSALRACEL